MKTTILKLVIVSLLLAMQSCSPMTKMILKISGEYKNPQIEDSLSVLTYCKEKQVNYDQLWMIKSKENYKVLAKDGGLGVPDVLIFNNKKNPVTNEIQTECSWALAGIVYDTNAIIIETGDSTLFYKIMDNFVLVDDRTLIDSPDFYIIGKWAKFLPKLSHSLFETINEQKASSNIKVKHILLNVDYQKDWYD
ncbi:MAG: hypothetical protein FD170_728 [Bacteroidetes bacterium]|nr:MAG: hypothetical protein FD170_728 [Bacteroidota bacterium]